MTAIIRPITALLASTAIVLMGSGLIGVLVPVRAGLDQLDKVEIGIIGSAYWIGLTLGCLVAPLVIQRVGHIRAFVAFTATVTITPLLFALESDVVLWSLLRIINGLCFAGIQMVIESWLSASSTGPTRGRIFAIYTILNLTVLTIGMQMIALGPPQSFELFSIVAILFSLAAVPVALTTTPPPSPPRSARLDLGFLFRVSPAAFVGAFCMGLTGGAFWGLAPIYGQTTGLSIVESATMMTVAILAGAVAQWPVGLLSDRLGRRPVLVLVTLFSALGGLGLYAVAGQGAMATYTVAFAYGLFAFAAYQISLALANDLVPKERAVEVSSGLLLTYAGGAIAGPVLASILMAELGPGSLFLYTAIVHTTTAAWILFRLAVRPEQPAEEREEFVLAPRTTPAIFELDPRAATPEPAFRQQDQIPPETAPAGAGAADQEAYAADQLGHPDKVP